MKKIKLQIGIIGSAASGLFTKESIECAKTIGTLIARSNNYLIFGAEKDQNSLSTEAALSCRSAGGKTIGITYTSDKKIWSPQSADIVIPSGLDRGGGREFMLIAACDVVITISGGAGTLNEIAVAYQLRIPIICLKNTGGWSQKIAGTYLDSRKREYIFPASTPEESIKFAIREGLKNKTL